jgi:hypothetical protein
MLGMSGMSGMSGMTCRMSGIHVGMSGIHVEMSGIHVGMSGMSGMSEMKRGSVGNVGIAKCECRDRAGAGVERFGTYVPIRGRRPGSRFEYLSEMGMGTNEDSETVLLPILYQYGI